MSIVARGVFCPPLFHQHFPSADDVETLLGLADALTGDVVDAVRSVLHILDALDVLDAVRIVPDVDEGRDILGKDV